MSLSLDKLSLGSSSLPETSDVPDSITRLLRGEMTNLESHLELLSTLQFNDIDISEVEEDRIKDSMDEFDTGPKAPDTINSQKYLQGCVRAIINFLKMTKNEPLDIPNERINEWFNPITTLNWDSTKNKWKSIEGIVSKIDLTHPGRGWTIKDFAIMKMQQPKAFEDENLLHEILVGLILNNMRDHLPCFTYTYGGIFCGYPTEDNLKIDDYNGLCGPGDKHSILITENIPGNLSMSTFIKDVRITEVEKDKVIIMLTFALDEANRRYKFNHGDLHSNNIMIRTLKNERDFNFVYVDKGLGEQSITIKTKYVPMIIDYGRTNIKFEGYNLRPIDASANNPELARDAGLFELWCIGGKRDQTGENCLPENLVFRGANIPGYDFIRLISSIDTSMLTDELSDAILHCFYNTNYDVFASGPYKNRLKGNLINYAKFTNQTLSDTKDPKNNIGCPKGGFLGYIISSPNFVGSTLEVVPI